MHGMIRAHLEDYGGIRAPPPARHPRPHPRRLCTLAVRSEPAVLLHHPIERLSRLRLGVLRPVYKARVDACAADEHVGADGEQHRLHGHGGRPALRGEHLGADRAADGHVARAEDKPRPDDANVRRACGEVTWEGDAQKNLAARHAGEVGSKRRAALKVEEVDVPRVEVGLVAQRHREAVLALVAALDALQLAHQALRRR
mmetsp:Transcript_44810/g.124256  ORF Transcript_44810/g.124256 Transcript_44810/m.124256 type:complete len:200 (-) Transcript_44810:137-736(-)